MDSIKEPKLVYFYTIHVHHLKLILGCVGNQFFYNIKLKEKVNSVRLYFELIPWREESIIDYTCSYYFQNLTSITHRYIYVYFDIYVEIHCGIFK